MAQVGRKKLEERRADKMVRVRVRVVRVRCFNQKGEQGYLKLSMCLKQVTGRMSVQPRTTGR